MILTEHPEVDFVQLQINYLDWEDAVAQSGRCYEVARKHGKYMTVMEPVKGGTLANLQGEAGTVFEEFYRKRGGKPIRYRQFLYIQLSGRKNRES